ncbi:MAG: hypothetical protein AB8E15_02410 [Bdellovibrionales bacterium]
MKFKLIPNYPNLKEVSKNLLILMIGLLLSSQSLKANVFSDFANKMEQLQTGENQGERLNNTVTTFEGISTKDKKTCFFVIQNARDAGSKSSRTSINLFFADRVWTHGEEGRDIAYEHLEQIEKLNFDGIMLSVNLKVDPSTNIVKPDEHLKGLVLNSNKLILRSQIEGRRSLNHSPEIFDQEISISFDDSGYITEVLGISFHRKESMNCEL